jgi:hypothetical protein
MERAQLLSAWVQQALPAQERAHGPEPEWPWVLEPVQNDSVASLVTPVAWPQQVERESRGQLVCLRGWALPLPEPTVGPDSRRQTADGSVPLPAAALTAYSSEECAAHEWQRFPSAVGAELFLQARYSWNGYW